MLNSFRTKLAAGLAMIALLPAGPRADDWPQWRGPNRDAVWPEAGLLQSFPTGGLKVRWRAPVGWGFSSPIVAQGRVYLSASEIIKPKAKERVHCFDEKTGKPLWTHVYDVAYEDWAMDPKQEVGPVSTPIVQIDKVYSIGRHGNLFCLDANKGDVLWHKNFDRDYQCGSPLIEGGLLILLANEKAAPCVMALNKDTGDEVWKALDETWTYSSPIVVTAGGKRQLIVWTQESVTSLNPGTGATYWRQKLRTSNEFAVSTPVVHKGRLLIGGLMFQLDADNPAAKVLWPDSNAPARRILSHTSTALLTDDYVFSAKSSGEFVCLEAATGKKVWTSENVTDLRNGASVHLTRNGDSVLLYTDKGELIRARLDGKGYHEMSRVAVVTPTFPFGGRNVAWSPPAYANGHIFVRNTKELVCAALRAGP